MSTYYNPDDDTITQDDRCERLAELGDYMRDMMLDRLLDRDGPSPEEIAADAKCDALDAADIKLEIKADALAILAKCGFMLTGYETQVCETASGVVTGMKSVDMAVFTTLRTQFSKEISDHHNQ